MYRIIIILYFILGITGANQALASGNMHAYFSNKYFFAENKSELIQVNDSISTEKIIADITEDDTQEQEQDKQTNKDDFSAFSSSRYFDSISSLKQIESHPYIIHIRRANAPLFLLFSVFRI